MLKPSYSELITLLNKTNNSNDIDSKITSRYTIVIAAAKRARQIMAGDTPLIKVDNIDKAVSIAVKEMSEGKLKIKSIDKNNEKDYNISNINTKEVDNLDESL